MNEFMKEVGIIEKCIYLYEMYDEELKKCIYDFVYEKYEVIVF